MNTKQIKDIKKGATQAKALYKGKTLLWNSDSTLSGIVMSENLEAFYTSSLYRKTDGESLSTLSTGYLTDYISGNEIEIEDSHLTSFYSATNPGVRVAYGSIDIPLSNMTKSVYMRYRVASAAKGNVNAINAFSSGYYGVSFLYERGTFTLRIHTGNSTPSYILPLSINPHEYHTYCMVYEGTVVTVYIDGQSIATKDVLQKPTSIYANAHFSNNITPIIETVALYYNSHTPNEVSDVTHGIATKYKYSVIPPENGLLLYDHGNTCDDVTNGWMLNSYDSWSGTICALGENAILLDGYNTRTIKRYCSSQPANLIDFTPYTKLYFLVSTSVFPVDLAYTTDVPGAKCGYTPSSDYTSSSERIYTETTVAGIIGKVGQTEDCAGLVCIDITDVDGMFAPFIADGAGAPDENCTKVYKVWLA